MGLTAETWQTIGTIAVLLAVGGYNAWRTIRAERLASQASAHAADAAEKIAPVGNGFAADVVDRLERIEKRTDQTHGLMIQHLSDHAGSDLLRDK